MSDVGKLKPGEEINVAIRQACQRSFGVLDSSFLCRSVSTLEPRPPLCVGVETSLEEVLALLKRERIGCVLITGENGKLTGIFSERDLVLKVCPELESKLPRPVREFMTADPVAEGPDASIAWALTLMSHGGFRHLPIVDGTGIPVGIISVKDVVDAIVASSIDDLLEFEGELPLP